MALNWTPEVTADFINTVILVMLAVLMFTSPKTKKIRTVVYFGFAWIFFSLFFLFEGFSTLFLSLAITRFYNLPMAVGVIFFYMGINYSRKDRLYSLALMVVIILSVLLLVLPFLTKIAIYEVEEGYNITKLIGIYSIISDLLLSIMLIYSFIWAIETLRNAPFLIKTEVVIFFLALTISSIITLILYFFYYLEPIFIVIADLTWAFGAFGFSFSIIRQPKLLYILPFEIDRIVVKDRDGFPLFDHDWSESRISESMFTGFINAVQLMSEEVIQKGGVLDIVLTDGILMLRESRYVSVGLVASKSSKLLRTSLINFTNEFEEKFSRLLKTSCKDMEKYDGAYELLDKYFSNFPSKLISSKKDGLYLIAKYKEIPLELENKLKDLIKDNIDYEKIIEEISKFPNCVPYHFMKFYEENKDVLEFRDEQKLPDKVQD